MSDTYHVGQRTEGGIRVESFEIPPHVQRAVAAALALAQGRADAEAIRESRRQANRVELIVASVVALFFIGAMWVLS